jgi:hydrogenase expression/formation protein HypD
MKYLSEYRDPTLARALIGQIRQTASRRWTLMEVCGGQTHTIVKQGLDELLGKSVK